MLCAIIAIPNINFIQIMTSWFLDMWRRQLAAAVVAAVVAMSPGPFPELLAATDSCADAQNRFSTFSKNSPNRGSMTTSVQSTSHNITVYIVDALKSVELGLCNA